MVDTVEIVVVAKVDVPVTAKVFVVVAFVAVKLVKKAESAVKSEEKKPVVEVALVIVALVAPRFVVVAFVAVRLVVVAFVALKRVTVPEAAVRLVAVVVAKDVLPSTDNVEYSVVPPLTPRVPEALRFPEKLPVVPVIAPRLAVEE